MKNHGNVPEGIGVPTCMNTTNTAQQKAILAILEERLRLTGTTATFKMLLPFDWFRSSVTGDAVARLRGVEIVDASDKPKVPPEGFSVFMAGMRSASRPARVGDEKARPQVHALTGSPTTGPSDCKSGTRRSGRAYQQ